MFLKLLRLRLVKRPISFMTAKQAFAKVSFIFSSLKAAMKPASLVLLRITVLYVAPLNKS